VGMFVYRFERCDGGSAFGMIWNGKLLWNMSEA
jgi:hypothetical protein